MEKVSSALCHRAEVWRQLHLLKLIAEALELESSPYPIHHLDSTGKDMECHGALRFYLFATDEGHGSLCTATYNAFKRLRLLAIE